MKKEREYRFTVRLVKYSHGASSPYIVECYGIGKTARDAFDHSQYGKKFGEALDIIAYSYDEAGKFRAETIKF